MLVNQGDTNPSSILEELKSITDIQLGYPKLSDLKGDLGGSGLLKGGLPTETQNNEPTSSGKVLDEARVR